MKPLLRPQGTPHPEVLKHQMGVSAAAFSWHDRKEFDARKNDLLLEIRRLVGAGGVFTRSEQEGHGDGLYGVYELEDSSRPSGCFGSVSFAYMGSQRQWGNMNGRLSWRAVPSDLDRLVRVLDTVWQTGAFDTLYAYDYDDHILQNSRTTLGMEYYGLDESQVELVRKGPVTEIETRHNPGYFTNQDGLHISVQWLNYWSKAAQGRIFGGRPKQLPPGVEVTDLEHGAIRIRLGERPGRYDDVEFHRLQLECRRCLGLLGG